jgi:hypothetical protein
MYSISRNSVVHFGTIVNNNDPDTYVDVKWSVSDPTFATVDDNGTVTILNKAGIITLIVTDKISGVSGAIVLRIT